LPLARLPPDVLGLLVVLALGHGAGVGVAGLPAAGQVGALDLVVLEHERQLDRVVLVHLLAAAGGGCFQLKRR
jgi:hypothetical protein